MKNIEDEFREIDRTNDWGRLFQQIKIESSSFEYTYKEARKTENKNLNRYRDVSPYDHSRVKLVEGCCDYINASLVQVPAARRSYILAQGPLPHTTGHFWQMIWEQNSKAVLMLNKVIEKNQIKCHQYFPVGRCRDPANDMVFDDVGLKVACHSDDEKSFYTLRKLKLINLKTNESRTVLHFHYTTWPDFGVPESPSAFLLFLLAVRNAGVLDENVGPPIVHCSAGIGRSGTFCLVDSCLVLIENSRDPNSINIKEVLMEMRKYRMGLIQTPDQLRFSYLAIIEGAKRISSGTFKENALINDDGKNNIIGRRSRSPSTSNDPEHSFRRDRRDSTSSASDRRNNYSTPREVNSSSLRERRIGSAKRAGSDFLSSGREDSPPPPLPPRRPKDSENSTMASTSIAPDQVNCVHNSSNDVSLNSDISDTELRRRLRHDRLRHTAERIEQIKKQQRDHEVWQKRRSKRTADIDRSPEVPPKRRRSHVNSSTSRWPFPRNKKGFK